MIGNQQNTKKNESGGSGTMLQRVYTSLLDFLRGNRVSVYRGLLLVSSAFLLYACKRYVYDRFVPITQVKALMAKGELSRVLLGNMLMMCYFKNPSSR